MNFLVALAIVIHFAAVLSNYNHQHCPCEMVKDHKGQSVSCSCYVCAEGQYPLNSEYLGQGQIHFNAGKGFHEAPISALLLEPIGGWNKWKSKQIDQYLCGEPKWANQYAPLFKGPNGARLGTDQGALGTFKVHETVPDANSKRKKKSKHFKWQYMKYEDEYEKYEDEIVMPDTWIPTAAILYYGYSTAQSGWIPAFDYIKKVVIKEKSLQNPCEKTKKPTFAVCRYCLYSISPLLPYYALFHTFCLYIFSVYSLHLICHCISLIDLPVICPLFFAVLEVFRTFFTYISCLYSARLSL